MKKGHMKNISVLLFIIAFGIGKTAAQTVEKKAVGLWYLQYDSTFTKDKLGNNFPSFFSSIRITEQNEIVNTVKNYGKFKVEQTLQFNPEELMLFETKKVWEMDTLRINEQKQFKLLTLTKDSLVFKKISLNTKSQIDSLVVFRKFSKSEIDTLLQGKKWINKDFNFSKIQNFVLSEPKAVYPRPYLSYDLSKQNGLKIEYPFGGGFNGKYMILEAVNDTSIRVFNYDNPGIWHYYNVLQLSAKGFTVEEIQPKAAETKTSSLELVKEDNVYGKYAWQMDGKKSELVLKEDKTFSFSYTTSTGDTSNYEGVFLNNQIYLSLYPHGFVGNEHLEWGKRLDKQVKKFYLGEPLKIGMNITKSYNSVDLVCNFVGGEREIVLIKQKLE